MLPAELNDEGQEALAAEWAKRALSVYASECVLNWGSVDDEGKLLSHRGYDYVGLVSFGYLVRTACASHPRSIDLALKDVVRAYERAELTDGTVDGFGSGAKAALALATYISGRSSMGPIQTPGQRKRGRPRKVQAA